MTGICAVNGCERQASIRGWCTMHYQRWQRTGSPGEATPRHRRHIPNDGATEIWRYVDKDGLGGCWLWFGALTEKGYGRGLHNGKMERVHRVSYELLVGPIPPGLQLDHLCRVRNCVNPAHLEVVTAAENRRRQTAERDRCSRGHLYTAETTYMESGRWRVCRICKRINRRRRLSASASSLSVGSQFPPTPAGRGSGGLAVATSATRAQRESTGREAPNNDTPSGRATRRERDGSPQRPRQAG